MTIRVLIADDEALIRSGIRLILAPEADIDVVAEASDGAGAVEAAGRLHPDVVLMDVRMPGLDGTEATRMILEAASRRSADQAPVRVLVLTTFHESEVVYRALRVGASGFLLKKDCGSHHLVEAVRLVAAGEAQLAPAVTRALIAEFAARPDERLPVPQQIASLTPTERRILTLIASAQSNAEIAARMGVSAGTVKTHVSHVFQKLGAHDRTHAAVIAYRCGLIQAR